MQRASQRRLIFTDSDREMFSRSQLARRLAVNEAVVPNGTEPELAAK
jgi:hypothetical protein